MRRSTRSLMEKGKRRQRRAPRLRRPNNQNEKYPACPRTSPTAPVWSGRLVVVRRAGRFHLSHGHAPDRRGCYMPRVLRLLGGAVERLRQRRPHSTRSVWRSRILRCFQPGHAGGFRLPTRPDLSDSRGRRHASNYALAALCAGFCPSRFLRLLSLVGGIDLISLRHRRG